MKSFYILMMFICIHFSGFSQKEDNFERINTLKIGYITEKIELTSGEAKDFWPIYNKYNEILHNLNVQIRNCRKSGCDKKENLTEKEALEILDKDSELMGKILQANREKDKELLKVISAKKLLLLKNAEKEFHRKLIKQYRNSK